MPSIHIQHAHAMGHDDAHRQVQRIADELARKHSVTCHWQHNRLAFSRPGLDGHIDVDDHHVTVVAALGLALLPLKSRLDQEIRKLLARHFPQG